MSQLLQPCIIAFFISITNIFNQYTAYQQHQLNIRATLIGKRTDSNHDILANRLHPSVLTIGDTIAASLRRYQTV